MRGYMKLKIIINKMTDFINKLVDIITSKYSKTDNHYRYNYFYYYHSNIRLLDDKTIVAVYDAIDRSANEIDNITIKEITYFLSKDISNETIIEDVEKIRNYIVFCLYSSLLDVKVRRLYFNKQTIVNIKEKVRPDKYLCEVTNYKNDFQFYAYGKTILQLPLVDKFTTYIKLIKELKSPMPYVHIVDNMIIYEKPTYLDPNKDPLVEVLKDIVNQLKGLDPYLKFEYMDKTSVGKSQNGLKRYFLFFLDSLIGNDETLTSFNVYDGRQEYDKISSKDQIRTVIHILSEIYVTGTDNYMKKCQIQPFSDYLIFLDGLQEGDIYNNFILYLMNIKNE